MRIIELEFENINSYEGKVHIDFTDKKFAEYNDQFVICGETASGKSTILDAITLALYGRTARMSAVVSAKRDGLNKSEVYNELINKRSGHCMAAVTYLCSKGKIRSEYRQKKAYSKRDGNLQPATFSVKNLDTQISLLTDKATVGALEEQTEKLIGLNYEQFISCVLIPQGEFDRFLSADDGQKAGILAKLSHTEKYKKAAVKLIAKQEEVEKEFQIANNALAGIPVMSIEERITKTKEKEELDDVVIELQKKINVLAGQISDKRAFSEANKKVIKAQVAIEELSKSKEDFDGKKNVLDGARRAQSCEGEYSKLEIHKKDLGDAKERKTKLEEKLSDLSKIMSEVKAEVSKCQDDRDALKSKIEIQKEIWKTVRIIDTNIASSQKNLKEKEQSSKKASEDFNKEKMHEERLTKEISALEKTISEISKYIEVHSRDKELEGLLGILDEKKRSLADLVKDIKRFCDQKALKEGEESKLIRTIQEFEKKRQELDDELKGILDEKHLIIARILRETLEDGKSCPVCGSIYHSTGCDIKDNAKEDLKDSDRIEQATVAEGVSEISQKLDEIAEEIRKSNAIRIEVATDISNQNEHLETSTKKACEVILSINDILAPWEIKVVQPIELNEQNLQLIVDELGREINKLNELHEAYQNNKKKLDDSNTDLGLKQQELKGIDLVKLASEKKNAEDAVNNAQSELNQLKAERKSKFDDKNVDEEELKMNSKLAEKEDKLNKSNENLNNINGENTKCQALFEDTQKKIKDLSELIENEQADFDSKLKTNGFPSEKEFLSCRRNQTEIDNLDSEIRKFLENQARANANLETAEKELVAARKDDLSEKSVEELESDKGGLENEKNEKSKLVGSIERDIENDKINVAKRKNLEEELNKIKAEKEIYDAIKGMLGKKDGTDFEVFVQVMAMKSLLVKVNEYLGTILPHYTLEQMGDSLKFELHEHKGDGSIEKRSIINLSGGERFIVSLSLALAMAEYAGNGGDIESLFLDEGFGTLSGEPLNEAIAALKRLGASGRGEGKGKMLGIITHIKEVQEEFLQIKAEKKGDRSKLSGPGITCSSS